MPIFLTRATYPEYFDLLEKVKQPTLNTNETLMELVELLNKVIKNNGGENKLPSPETIHLRQIRAKLTHDPSAVDIKPQTLRAFIEYINGRDLTLATVIPNTTLFKSLYSRENIGHTNSVYAARLNEIALHSKFSTKGKKKQEKALLYWYAKDLLHLSECIRDEKASQKEIDYCTAMFAEICMERRRDLEDFKITPENKILNAMTRIRKSILHSKTARDTEGFQTNIAQVAGFASGEGVHALLKSYCNSNQKYDFTREPIRPTALSPQDQLFSTLDLVEQFNLSSSSSSSSGTELSQSSSSSSSNLTSPTYFPLHEGLLTDCIRADDSSIIIENAPKGIDSFFVAMACALKHVGKMPQDIEIKETEDKDQKDILILRKKCSDLSTNLNPRNLEELLHENYVELIKKDKNQGGTIEGSAAAEGWLLCTAEDLNIRLHIINIDPDEEDLNKHFIVTKEGYQQVMESQIDYLDENIIHLVTTTDDDPNYGQVIIDFDKVKQKIVSKEADAILSSASSEDSKPIEIEKKKLEEGTVTATQSSLAESTTEPDKEKKSDNFGLVPEFNPLSSIAVSQSPPVTTTMGSSSTTIPGAQAGNTQEPTTPQTRTLGGSSIK